MRYVKIEIDGGKPIIMVKERDIRLDIIDHDKKEEWEWDENELIVDDRVVFHK
jgi:hypothetical protein